MLHPIHPTILCGLSLSQQNHREDHCSRSSIFDPLAAGLRINAGTDTLFLSLLSSMAALQASFKPDEQGNAPALNHEARSKAACLIQVYSVQHKADHLLILPFRGTTGDIEHVGRCKVSA